MLESDFEEVGLSLLALKAKFEDRQDPFVIEMINIYMNCSDEILKKRIVGVFAYLNFIEEKKMEDSDDNEDKADEFIGCTNLCITTGATVCVRSKLSKGHIQLLATCKVHANKLLYFVDSKPTTSDRYNILNIKVTKD